MQDTRAWETAGKLSGDQSFFLRKEFSSDLQTCTTLKNPVGHNELVSSAPCRHSGSWPLFWETEPYLALKRTHSSDVSADKLSWLTVPSQSHISASAVWTGRFDSLYRRDSRSCVLSQHHVHLVLDCMCWVLGQERKPVEVNTFFFSCNYMVDVNCAALCSGQTVLFAPSLYILFALLLFQWPL